jgi:hypothetical protein
MKSAQAMADACPNPSPRGVELLNCEDKMKTNRAILCIVAVACAIAILQSCGKSDSSTSTSGTSSGSSGGGGSVNATYTSLDTANEKLTVQFKSNGTVHMSSDIGTDEGTYVADGDKITVTVKNQKFTFIRSGNCIEDITVFGKLCIGGKAGEAASAATPPKGPSGTYVATHEVGDFKLEFRAGNALTLTATPKGEKTETGDGTYTIEGSTIYVNLPLGEKMTLTYVNDTLETSAFGFPLKFIKR